MSTDVSGGSAFDMSELHALFFDEAAEHLANMEALLLGIDVAAADTELLNAVFRVAHSIKGGAAAMGFADITALTHEMEAVFDSVRKGRTTLSLSLVDTFLVAGDMLRAMLAAKKGAGAVVAETEAATLCVRLHAFLAQPVEVAEQLHAQALPPNENPVLELVFGPLDDAFTTTAVDAVVADLKDFGIVEEIAMAVPAQGLAERRFWIETTVSADDLTDALAFMADPERVRVVSTPVVSPHHSTADSGTTKPSPPATVSAAQRATVNLKAAPVPATITGDTDAQSIRVSTEKINQMINLVGELVITQAMLLQTASKADPRLCESLLDNLGTLERNTHDLQEAALSMRMMPMARVFSRFPRLVRELSARLGKEVELITSGGATELDKGMIENIVDPLTHLVRNSLDHGLEPPAERMAHGKPRKGRITLSACHQGGAIVISVADDGRGLRRDKILAKAKACGMAASDAMSDAEVWALIFETGFSTADTVTDVSGRGVGMDVVRRNIEDLGGRVEIASTTDEGSQIIIRLPLTLAILDGMSVRVGSETFVVPLIAVTESLQAHADAVKWVQGRGQVLSVRGEYVPVVTLAEVLGRRAEKRRFEDGILVIVETAGGKTALFVDALVGQHQVVIKSLETNYRKVAGISGATIMGDGRVALIIDVAWVATIAHSRMERAA